MEARITSVNTGTTIFAKEGLVKVNYIFKLKNIWNTWEPLEDWIEL